jgi:cysteine synthase A
MIYQNISQLVGHTPLFFPAKLAKDLSLKAKVLCKLECSNPAGSAKDRIALAMITAAENAGILKEDSIIVEPTSGNTGIGLAAIAASRGYRVILTMPESMSIERRRLLSMYGAEIVLTSAELGMQGAIQKAEEIARECKNAWIPSQFDNSVNAEAHYKTTGPEIWNDTEGSIDFFVAGVGTGGTLTGVGRYLKEQSPNVTIVAVEPSSSPLLSQGRAGVHGLQGIGANFIPSVLDQALIDEIFPVTEEDAYQAGRSLAKSEGILCGITSGAALYAALQLAERPENEGKTIICLLPDTGARYLSTPYFE